jgi:hypothetical protein
MDKQTRERINELQDIDPLGAAEILTGRSYKDDPATTGIGLALLHEQRDMIQALCSEHDDIYYDLDIQNCLRILAEEGFEIFNERVKHSRHSNDARAWTLWHPTLHILGEIDSYMQYIAEDAPRREKLNSLTITGQFVSPDDTPVWELCPGRASGTVNVRRHDLADVKVASWNVRDGLRQLMAEIRESRMIPVDGWTESLWSPCERGESLPEHVQDVVCAQVPILKISELAAHGK